MPEDKKPKLLPPALRDKKRYLAIKVYSAEKISIENLTMAFSHSLLNTLGELGASRADTWLIKDTYDEKTQSGIVRCSTTSVEEVRASLTLIQTVGDMPVSINVLGVSGTIKASKQKYFGERDLTSFT